jgi:Flp pilus assembly pilin Flp
MFSLRALWRDEAGAQLVEYVLLVSLIAIVCLMGVQFFGEGVRILYHNSANNL